jgi:phosphohistidine phosphatase SixA
VRELILLRHAHADAAPLEGTDAERPLSARGRSEASQAAVRLLGLALVPDLVLFSPAARTRETAEILRTTLGLPLQAFRELGPLYLAAAPILRAQIATVEPGVHRLMIIGHNPGLSELADELDPKQRGTVLVNAGYVHVSIGGAGWRGLAPA